MRVVYIFLLTPLTLFLLSNRTTCAQSTLFPAPFPTYQQIKPPADEIIDYAPEQGNLVTAVGRQPINLFDYSDYTVTYILNSKPTTDRKYAKDLIDSKGTRVDRIKIGQPTADGSLTIEIDYSTHK